MTSTKKATRKAIRLLTGRRHPDAELTPLDTAFGLTRDLRSLVGVGRPDFDYDERRRRRARGKRQRAARRANR